MDGSDRITPDPAFPLSERQTLPLMIVDTSTLKKLYKKSTKFHERSKGLDPQLQDLSRTPFELLRKLSDELHVTLVIPRAVLGETLLREHGSHQEMRGYIGQNGEPVYEVNTNTKKLFDSSKPFANFLNEFIQRAETTDLPGVRYYRSTADMLAKEDLHTGGGVIILDSGKDRQPINHSGVYRFSPFHSQLGDIAIRLAVKQLNELIPGGAHFPVLAEDGGFGALGCQPGSKRVFPITLRSLIKSLPSKTEQERSAQNYFFDLMDYRRDPSRKENTDFFSDMVTCARQWQQALPEHDKPGAQNGHRENGSTEANGHAKPDTKALNSTQHDGNGFGQGKYVVRVGEPWDMEVYVKNIRKKREQEKRHANRRGNSSPDR